MNALAHLVQQTLNPPRRPARTDPLSITYTVQRTYTPAGRTREILAFLRERGSATTREIAAAGGIDARQVGTMMRAALNAGAVRHVGEAVWEWCE